MRGGEHLNRITSWFALRTETGIARLKYIKDKGIGRIPWQMGSLMKKTNNLINRKKRPGEEEGRRRRGKKRVIGDVAENRKKMVEQRKIGWILHTESR